jgi:uncharacterized protein YjbJ (UPF0337 family)
MGEILDKLKGKLKQVEGAITGDRKKQVEGVVDEKKGDVKRAFEDVKHDLRNPK